MVWWNCSWTSSLILSWIHSFAKHGVVEAHRGCCCCPKWHNTFANVPIMEVQFDVIFVFIHYFLQRCIIDYLRLIVAAVIVVIVDDDADSCGALVIDVVDFFHVIVDFLDLNVVDDVVAADYCNFVPILFP